MISTTSPVQRKPATSSPDITSLSKGEISSIFSRIVIDLEPKEYLMVYRNLQLTSKHFCAQLSGKLSDFLTNDVTTLKMSHLLDFLCQNELLSYHSPIRTGIIDKIAGKYKQLLSENKISEITDILKQMARIDPTHEYWHWPGY